MRKLTFLLVPLFLLACDRQPVAPDVSPDFAATSEWYEDTIVLPEGDLFYYAPCIDDDLDEIGTLYRKRHRVIQPDGVSVVHWNIRPGDDFIARGASTGDWYPIGGFHTMITTTLNSAQHQTQIVKWTVKNATTGVVLDWPIRYHITINANGDVTIERYVEPCSVRLDN